MEDFQFDNTPNAEELRLRRATNSPPPNDDVYCLLALVCGFGFLVPFHNVYARRWGVVRGQGALCLIAWVVRLAPLPNHLLVWWVSTAGGWLLLWNFYDLCCVRTDGAGRSMR